MTDEEMAGEYAGNISGLDINTTIMVAENKTDAYRLGIYEGFLAGLKAGRPQWHKVADGDLPKDEKDMLMSDHLILLTRMKGTDNLSISIGQFNFSTQEFDYQHIVGLTDVIAWKEIVLPELPKVSE